MSKRSMLFVDGPSFQSHLNFSYDNLSLDTTSKQPDPLQDEESGELKKIVKAFSIELNVAIDILGGKRSLVKNIIAQTTILKRAIKK